MTAPIWETPAGFLGTYTERITTSVSLVATGTDISYSLISGSLPVGLYLNSSTGVLIGTPVSIPTNTTSEFVIRAKNNEGLSDRTFDIEIVGPTTPEWATPSGPLPVGINGEYYAVNREYVDYTLRAETDILATGNTLKYYIGDNQGQLPPGLKLTTSGRIVGYINDTLKLDNEVSLTGGYDTERFDRYPYDHGVIINNVVQLVKPVSINKIYQFYVTVTDGISSAVRLFNIEVVDPDSLRADNTYFTSDELSLDASSGFLFPPIWQNKYGEILPKPANLGTVRASSKQIISLYEYDPYPFTGSLTWDWSTTVNPEIKVVSDSEFNPAGFETRNLPGDTSIYVKNVTVPPLKGMKIRLDEWLPGFTNTTYTITGVIEVPGNKCIINIDQPLPAKIPDSKIFALGTPSVHPVGMNLDTKTGELYGTIPYQPAYSQTYRFTIKIIKTDRQSGESVESNQIFLLTIKGDIESYIEYVSTSSLGTLVPGQTSELAVVARNVNTDYSVQYELVRGRLPVGLNLNSDGTIEGQVQYKTQTYFDFTSTNTSFMIDGGNTTIDKNWYFTIRAYDVYKLSAVDKEFFITVNETSLTEYTRIFVKPFMSQDKREAYSDFTSNPVTFDPAILYRPNDPEFGVQTSIKMLLETGIEKVDINNYANAMGEYFYRKRFYFGDIKSVPAKDASGNLVYELIYAEIIDDQMIGNYSPSYAVSVGNMQKALEEIEIDPNIPIIVDEQFRPRYMSTEDPTTGVPLGFIKAVPICYALPGNSDKILSRIKSSGIDLTQFDFDTDRIIVETPLEADQNGWLFYPTGRR